MKLVRCQVRGRRRSESVNTRAGRAIDRLTTLVKTGGSGGPSSLLVPGSDSQCHITNWDVTTLQPPPLPGSPPSPLIIIWKLNLSYSSKVK